MNATAVCVCLLEIESHTQKKWKTTTTAKEQIFSMEVRILFNQKLAIIKMKLVF